ncbi:MAG: transposase, partial [Acidobacteria bacterium]|nr:transposase [Acidobacteriota bacterium]
MTDTSVRESTLINTTISDKPRRKYDDEFKRQAVQMIANGQPVSSVAQSLGIGEKLLHKWKARAPSVAGRAR